ncbi:MAG TPA: hypothetical protein VFF72_06205, partial [Caldimonas sp.]|nr:hypothetical protein [Caldimonas sp.]
MMSSAEPNSMSAAMKLAKAERDLSAAGAAGRSIHACRMLRAGVAESTRTLSRRLRLRGQISPQPLESTACVRHPVNPALERVVHAE